MAEGDEERLDGLNVRQSTRRGSLEDGRLEERHELPPRGLAAKPGIRCDRGAPQVVRQRRAPERAQQAGHPVRAEGGQGGGVGGVARHVGDGALDLGIPDRPDPCGGAQRLGPELAFLGLVESLRLRKAPRQDSDDSPCGLAPAELSRRADQGEPCGLGEAAGIEHLDQPGCCRLVAAREQGLSRAVGQRGVDCGNEQVSEHGERPRVLQRRQVLGGGQANAGILVAQPLHHACPHRLRAQGAECLDQRRGGRLVRGGGESPGGLQRSRLREDTGGLALKGPVPTVKQAEQPRVRPAVADRCE